MDGAQLCVATCYLFVQQKRSEEKAGDGTRMLRCACERAQPAREGVRAQVRCYGDGGGAGALLDIRQSERER